MTQVIEFFCGIGGLSNCLPAGTTATGIDISGKALEIYQRNFGHPVISKTIESLTADDLAGACREDSLWWMSPPCQPHTRRGLQRDLQDTRSKALVNVVRLVQQCRPAHLGLENVPEFADSESRQLLESALDECGYQFGSLTLCPTRLGATNRRERFYLIASQGDVEPWRPPQPVPQQPRLEEEPDLAQLILDAELQADYQNAIHVVDREAFLSGSATTRCFTSAYGRSPVGSGSYLDSGNWVRRFSPREILWQLGFPQDFYLPHLPCKRLWPVVGNSLSRAAVRHVLQHLPVDLFAESRNLATVPPAHGRAEG